MFSGPLRESPQGDGCNLSVTIAGLSGGGPPCYSSGDMKPKILVVDDEPEAVELVEFNLKQAGFEVVTAADGAEALKKARALLPNLIVLDLMLPEVDGLEVCKMVRRDPATAAHAHRDGDRQGGGD